MQCDQQLVPLPLRVGFALKLPQQPFDPLELIRLIEPFIVVPD